MLRFQEAWEAVSTCRARRTATRLPPRTWRRRWRGTAGGRQASRCGVRERGGRCAV